MTSVSTLAEIPNLMTYVSTLAEFFIRLEAAGTEDNINKATIFVPTNAVRY